MGNPIGEKEEREAIEEISKLSKNSKTWIGHHIRNAITPLVLTCDCSLSEEQKEDLLNKCFDHISNDLKQIGC